ncbi:unnamed protein product [Cunninghamella blakesleeana]
MAQDSNCLWITVGILSIFLYPLYFLASLSGINRTIHSIGKEGCSKILSPNGDLAFCEDIVLVNGIAYASCDPSREKINKVLDYNYYKPNEAIPSGNIWQIDYKADPVKLSIVTKNVNLKNFHPLGIAASAKQNVLLAINLPVEPDSIPTIEVFSIQNNDNKEVGSTLVHKKTIQHDNIYNPNAIHLVDDFNWYSTDGVPSFFFSNDHYYQKKALKILENTAILPISNVMFYDARHNTVFPVIHDLAFANGVSGNDSILFVSETNKLRVNQYKLTLNDKSDDPKEAVKLKFIQKVNVNMAVDNLDYVSSTDQLIIGGHPKGIDFMKFAYAKDRSHPSVKKAASLVTIWNPSSKDAENNLKTFFSDDGNFYATSTTGALDTHNQKLLIASLYDKGILVCDA